jgi:hypothetical protein
LCSERSYGKPPTGTEFQQFKKNLLRSIFSKEDDVLLKIEEVVHAHRISILRNLRGVDALDVA